MGAFRTPSEKSTEMYRLPGCLPNVDKIHVSLWSEQNIELLVTDVEKQVAGTNGR